MIAMEHFGACKQAEVTVLVDNRSDLIVKSTDTVKYYTDGPLLAEHGYAALIHLPEAGVKILWDAGLTETALVENMRRLEVDPDEIDLIALSHGHGDHTAGFEAVLKMMSLRPEPKEWESGTGMEEMRRYAAGRRVPLVLHPAALRERWAETRKGGTYGPIGPAPSAAWELAGAELVLSEGPYRLAPGCWTTGFVPRRSFEHSGIPKKLYYWLDGELHKDLTEEDQAIVLHIQGKGLVVLSGCAHAGIVNTITHAREISGVEQVWAVLGGFHLARASAEDIQRTIDAIKALEPALIVPSHCTGPEAIRQFAIQMPDAFVHGVVGATYLF